VENLI
jgi:hypothetical protein